jgi:hypothetical protein
MQLETWSVLLWDHETTMQCESSDDATQPPRDNNNIDTSKLHKKALATKPSRRSKRKGD